MDINQTIKDRLNQLPEDIQQAITSNDLGSKFDQIAQKNNLHIDQNGNLQTETLLVMLGLENSSDYIDNLQSSLEINRNEAIQISNDVNELILKPIKESLRIMQELHEQIDDSEAETNTETEQKIIEPAKPEPVAPAPISPKPNQISDIERIGQFTIEPKSTPSSSPLYKDTNLNREDILKSIEDPIPENKPLVAPLIDHLLTTPVNNAQKVEQKEVVDKNVNQSPKSYSADPYREQII